MISHSAIWAIVLRHVRLFKRDINALFSSFYWPLLDILIWGFLGSWIQRYQIAALSNYKETALLGILLWQVVGRGCNFMCNAFSEELWSNNIINIFSLPLRIIEWICGVIIFYAIKISITTVVCMSIMFMLYDLPIGSVVTTFFLFLPPLFLCGIWIGFTCLQIIVTLGKRGTELGYVFAWFLLPFSGAYYPTDVLPEWGQAISRYIPMSYLFQGMREYLMKHQDPTPYLIKGYALSAFYATYAIIVFVHCFKRTKQKGLARLAD